MNDAGYKRLEVYQLAHQLGIDVHRATLLLPKQEMYEMGSQIRRASKAISANIVEGYGRRRYKAEWIKFLTYAYATCLETCEWTQYLMDCYPNDAPAYEFMREDAHKLSRKLYLFIQAVEREHQTDRI
jgi:four helix bundle protein